MKKGYIIGLIVFLVCFCISYSCIRSCVPVIPEMDKKPAQVVESPITEKDKAILPDVAKKLVYRPAKPKIGHKVETSILQGTTQTVVVEEQKIDWGFKNRLGLFGSAHLSTLDVGVSYKTLYYWRANLDILAGARFGGAGLSFQTFDNTAIGGAWTYSWTTLTPSPAIYISMGF